MKNPKNYIISLIILFISVSNLFSSEYSVDINAIEINGKVIKNYDNIIVAETDTIIFRYILNQGSSKAISPFLYKLVLTINGEISERTAGLTEVLYCNLSEGRYIFEVSAFDLSGKWMTINKRINFVVNNEIAKLKMKIDTLESSNIKNDSTINVLQESINSDKSWNKLSKIIIYLLIGVTVVFLILFILSLFRNKKKILHISSLNTILEESSTKILALETLLNKSCDIEEVEKLKNKIETINKQLENISKLNGSFTNDVSAVQDKVAELSNLQGRKNNIFGEIVRGISSPTDTIKGLVDLLRSYDFNVSETNDIVTNIIDYTYKIIDNAESIQRLIEIEDEVKLNFDSVSIPHIIEVAVNKNIIDANKKNINININIASDVTNIQADQQKLIVVLHNLINNAVKFTNENGKINIEVYKKNNLIHFEVNDNGIGINQTDLQRLYRNLSSEHNPDMTISSNSTIGLLTIKKYIEAHNGKIMVSSVINKGSSFSFNIPDKKY